MSDFLFLLLQKIVPQRSLSALCARVAGCQKPKWFKNSLIKVFVKIFDVDMREAFETDISRYANFNDFFTRPLKSGSRPIGSSDIVSPADGTISQFGLIKRESLVQAKGRFFLLSELLGSSQKLPQEDFQDGAFLTIYLSPSDYHRFHMPVSGDLLSTRYIPGKLFSVNDITAKKLENLYARNERYIANFSNENSYFSIVAVGAMIVAGIETVWSGTVASSALTSEKCEHQYLEKFFHLDKGEEIGRFKFGSTVIILFPRGTINWEKKLYPGQRIRMGESIANYK